MSAVLWVGYDTIRQIKDAIVVRRSYIEEWKLTPSGRRSRFVTGGSTHAFRQEACSLSSDSVRFLRFAATFLVASCGSDNRQPTEPPPDTIAPSVRIDFPVDSTDEFLNPATRYDENGNGLIDIRASWSDAGGGVDPATARIEIVGGINGTSGSGDDLRGLWTQVTLDGDRLAFEETIAELARQGTARLVVSVADSAGNRGADTMVVRVRYGDFHRSIALGGSGIPAPDGVVCEDDLRLYVAYGNAIVVIDAQTLEVVGSFPAVLPEPPASLLCVEGDENLYASVRLERFNRSTLSWLPSEPSIPQIDGLALSELDSDIVWGGAAGIGVPVQIDRTTLTYFGEVGFPHSSATNEFVAAVAVLPYDDKIYFSRAREAGVVSGDPATGEQLVHVDLDPDFPELGRTNSLAVHPSLPHVYAAVISRSPGIVEIDPATDMVSRRLIFLNNAIDVSLNRSGTRMWVTTHDSHPDIAARSHLIDPIAWRILESFPRPVPPATTMFVLDGSFRPDGKLVFQVRDDAVDIYLIRE